MKKRIKRQSIDVSFTFEGGWFHVRRGDGAGLASCALWADIAPDPFAPGDYVFVGVFLESHFVDDGPTKLTGNAEKEAIAILEADKHWKDWAERELREMTGEVEEEYDMPRVM